MTEVCPSLNRLDKVGLRLRVELCIKCVVELLCWHWPAAHIALATSHSSVESQHSTLEHSTFKSVHLYTLKQ